MSPVPVSPRRVFGVAFSAAADAGEHIHVCRAHPGSDGIRIESVDPLSDLPGGARDLAGALRALVVKVGESPRSAWGFDFAFALPAPVLEALAPAARGHSQQLEVVAAFGDADALRARCRAAHPGTEARRRTDREALTPFSPYAADRCRQTFHGMADVLRPLRGRAEVALLPFDPLPSPGTGDPGRLDSHRRAEGPVPHVYVLEVCPVSLLAALGSVTQGYEGEDLGAEARRHAIFGELAGAGLVRPAPRALRRRIIQQPGGRALDAVLAAVAAWRGYREHDHGRLRDDPDYAREGFVYR